jgi:hypothetical protein
MLNALIRAKRPDGLECAIDLIELEAALSGAMDGEWFFFPESGKIDFRQKKELFPFGGRAAEEEDEEEDIPLAAEIVLLDPISSHERFRWMEAFLVTVHSIAAQSALRNALRHKKPFRNFKDALMEYPAVRQQWFQFEAARIKQEAVALIESFDWEILEVIDNRFAPDISIEIDPAERLPPTGGEREWILRGASEIAAKGGRAQLALLLKGSKDKKLLKHNLNHSPVYGKLSFLTIPEIENRIDHLVRTDELRVEFFGDLPLILLSDCAWEQVRPWSNKLEAGQAAAAGGRDLNELLLQWRGRPRHEQLYLLEAVTTLDCEAAQRILRAWRGVAGKEVRERIEKKLVSGT